MQNTMREIPFKGSRKLRKYHKARVAKFDVEMKANTTWEETRQKWIDAGSPKDHPLQDAMVKAANKRTEVLNRSKEKLKDLARKIDEGEMERYVAALKDWRYSDANAYKPSEHLSPSGKYKLVITSHPTGPGTWSFTKGVVSKDGEIIGEVRRNYSSFPFTWMEDHINGHDYLVAGEDYQGQTFIELDTGRRRDFLPDAASEGFGFCWADYRLLGDGKTLLVDGCYWACPYELKFFNVSDPMNGWPEIELPCNLDYLDPGKSEIKVEGDDILWLETDYRYKPTGELWYDIERKWESLHREVRKAQVQEASQEVIDAAEAAQEKHEEFYGEEDPDEDLDEWEQVVNRRIRLTIEDGEFVVAEDWKSEWQQEKARRYEEYQAKSNAERQQWRDNDALYQHLLRQRDVHCGYMYPSQHDRWKGDTNPAYFRITVRDEEETTTRTATVQWGVANGDVTLELWVRGKGNTNGPSFPRTPEGVDDAWAAAMGHVTEGSWERPSPFDEARNYIMRSLSRCQADETEVSEDLVDGTLMMINRCSFEDKERLYDDPEVWDLLAENGRILP